MPSGEVTSAEAKREARDLRDPRSPLNVSTGDRAEYIEIFSGNVLKKGSYVGSPITS